VLIGSHVIVKQMGMVLNESLRLYPPVVALIRQAGQDMKLGNLSVPGGTQLLFPIIALHHDPSLWGDNAKEFDPERFCDGVSKAAKHPMAFMPFGMGPRICVGQNFAVLQAKLILAMILQRFSFSLSPTYTHAPIPVVFLQPQFGAQMVMTPLSQE
jgi:PHYB activation tagged suppressor 1